MMDGKHFIKREIAMDRSLQYRYKKVQERQQKEKTIGEEWKILETKIGNESKGDIGVISEVNKDSFGINTSDGVLLITKVKRPGKNEMLVKDLFNGYNKDSLLNTKVGE